MPSAAFAAVATIAALPLRAMTEASDSPVVSPMVTLGSPPALPCRPGRTNPSSALRARMRVSAMQPLSLGIVENGAACLHRHFAAPQEVAGAQFLAHALTSAREEPKADPMAQHGRIGNRAHETLIVPGVGFRALGDEMRPRPQALIAIDGFETDNLRAGRIDHAGPAGHDPTDVILFGRHHLAQGQIARGGLAVQLAARHMTLFDAHDAQRLGAIGCDGEFAARLHDRANRAVAEAC